MRQSIKALLIDPASFDCHQSVMVGARTEPVVYDEDLSDLLEDALATLTEFEREAVELVYVSQLGERPVSARLGCSRWKLRRTLETALAKLAAALIEAGYQPRTGS